MRRGDENARRGDEDTRRGYEDARRGCNTDLRIKGHKERRHEAIQGHKERREGEDVRMQKVKD